MQRLPLTKRWLLLLVITVVASACGTTSTDDVHLHVPYVAQDNNYYCGPASVLMWRLFDGLPPVTQTQIADYMGTTDACGTFSYRIADGVSAFTVSGSDAIWDFDDYDNLDYFIARQITSVDTSIPVLAIAGSFHAGIVDGGHHHEIPDTGGMQAWDYVYFHDPLIGPDRYYDAADWLNGMCAFSGDSCEQIISNSATGGWYNNYNLYGEDVVIGGGAGRPGGEPPAY